MCGASTAWAGFWGRVYLGFLLSTMLMVTGDWHQFKKQLAAALLCAVYSFIVAFALMKGLMVVICVVKILRRVRVGIHAIFSRDTLADFHTGRHGCGS